MSHQQRLRQTLIWAGCGVLLAGALVGLALSILHTEEGELPWTYWLTMAAVLVTLSVWGWTLRKAAPVAQPEVAPEAWDELRASLPEGHRKLLDGMALATRPMASGPVRLREVVQGSLRRLGVQALVHEGGDPHVAGDAEALGYTLDRLLEGREGVRVELRTEGKIAELAIYAGAVEGQSILRRVLEAQGGELLAEGEAVRIRLPLAL